MTTTTLTLTDFLLARIGEDEAEGMSVHACRYYSRGQRHPGEQVPTGPFPVARARDRSLHPECAECQIDERNDARVLVEAKAKRAIVDLHRPVEQSLDCHCGKEHGPWTPAMCGVCPSSTAFDPVDRSAPCETLRLLATTYADHPDFREEWRA